MNLDFIAPMNCCLLGLIFKTAGSLERFNASKVNIFHRQAT